MCKNYTVGCRRFHDFAEVGVDAVVLLLRDFMTVTLLVSLRHGELMNNMKEVSMRSSEEEEFGKHGILVYVFVICTPVLVVGMHVLLLFTLILTLASRI
jgi:hypothetical protein